jgi:hypothetical protein
MDPRYRVVYRAYRRLIDEQRVLDESWSWQQALWADSVRQLTYSYLYPLLVTGYQSSLYCRREPSRGSWTIAPLAPGPFKTRSGDLHVVDSVDVLADSQSWLRERSPFATTLGATGCDVGLWWPEQRCLVLIWAVVRTADGAAWERELNGAAEALTEVSSALRASDGRAWDVRGLVVAACTEIARGLTDGPTQSLLGTVRAVGLRFGVGGDRGVDVADFEAGLQLATEPHLR